MRQVHRAGERIFIYFSGKKLHLMDPRSGEVIEVELLVGALGASGHTHVEAVASQDLPCWMGAHRWMFSIFGGFSAIPTFDCVVWSATEPRMIFAGTPPKYSNALRWQRSQISTFWSKTNTACWCRLWESVMAKAHDRRNSPVRGSVISPA
jgi:hypothetical protein